MASKHAWKIEVSFPPQQSAVFQTVTKCFSQLIPWDHLSPEHVKRMYDQRVACGWRSDEVPSWVEAAKKGGKIFYWVAFSDTLPDRDQLIQKHVEAYPKESTYLRDTAAEIRLVPRQPTVVEFIPIGHVAVDIHTPEEDLKLGLPATGTVWIHQLYISYTLQRGGFGAGTISKIETLAAKDPMNAKIIALDTLSREMQTDPEWLEVLYGEGRLPPPAVSNEEWYTRQGYEVFKRERNAYTWNLKEGISTPMNLVYMRKSVG